MKITVLDTCTVTNGDVSLDEIKKLGDVRFFDVVEPKDIADTIGDSDAVICNKAKITDDIMEKCENLRYVGLFATGYNNIDTKAASRRGIAVCNVPGYSTDSVAQTAWMHILNLAGHAFYYDNKVKSGSYAQGTVHTDPTTPFMELTGKRKKTHLKQAIELSRERNRLFDKLDLFEPEHS